MPIQKKRGRPKNSVWVNGEGYTPRMHAEMLWGKVRATHLTKTDVLRQKIFTRADLLAHIRAGRIRTMQLGRVTFVNKEDMVRLKTDLQPHLFVL